MYIQSVIRHEPEMDHHKWDKWFKHARKHHKENQLLSLEQHQGRCLNGETVSHTLLFHIKRILPTFGTGRPVGHHSPPLQHTHQLNISIQITRTKYELYMTAQFLLVSEPNQMSSGGNTSSTSEVSLSIPPSVYFKGSGFVIVKKETYKGCKCVLLLHPRMILIALFCNLFNGYT